MKREIKFRAWDGKRIIYLCDVRNDTSLILNEWGWEAVDHFSGKMESLILSKKNESAILMQFTGLKDRDGKDVYESDILGYPESTLFNWLVLFEGGCFGIKNIGVGKTLMNFYRCDGIYMFTDRIVTGNIYENPELV